MDAVIKVKPEELTDAFLQQLKQLAANARRIEIRLDGVDAFPTVLKQKFQNGWKSFLKTKPFLSHLKN